MTDKGDDPLLEEEQRVLSGSAELFLRSVDVVIGAASVLPLDRQQIVLSYLSTMINGLQARNVQLQRTMIENQAALN